MRNGQRTWYFTKRFVIFAAVLVAVFLFLYPLNNCSEPEHLHAIVTGTFISQMPADTGTNDTLYSLVEPQLQNKSSWLQLFHILKAGTQLNATELNNTKHAAKDIIFFNRVPKVGSQTMMELLIRLADRNGFRFHRDGGHKKEIVQLAPQREDLLTRLIDAFRPPSVYAMHTSFSNFSRYGREMPIYINMVRDPIERVISWFYYVRAPWYIVERHEMFPESEFPDTDWLKRDFESCVLEGDEECQFISGDSGGFGDHRRQMMFFCGHDKRCREFNGEWAMQRAKENVAKYYAVVGVLEQMNVTLEVLQKYIPRFFEGATEIYYGDLETLLKVNRNIYKPPVPEYIKNILRKNFTRELEFYEFCKERLRKQYSALLQVDNTLLKKPNKFRNLDVTEN